jgi:hypothetical protein
MSATTSLQILGFDIPRAGDCTWIFIAARAL